MKVVHDGWIRRAPVLSGAELRELEARVSALRALKRSLRITEHDAINAALTRAHEARDADARRPATAAEIDAARAASAELGALLERAAERVPAAPTPAAATAAPVAAPIAPAGALVLSAPSKSTPSKPSSSKRRAA